MLKIPIQNGLPCLKKLNKSLGKLVLLLSVNNTIEHRSIILYL
jgi:hypothetical protein